MTIRKSGIILFLALLVSIQASEENRKKRQAYGIGGYNNDAYNAVPYRAQQQQPQQYQQQPAPYQQPKAQHYPPQHKQVAPGEEEKEQGPHPLQKLLENSKFECGPKKDGYYADSDVGCQAFHYCVGGHKHSMMCPSGTVFHQVHLNCVPADQDICSKADKFFFVNDYLNKPLEQKGPNNTVQYHQRYYPDGYAVGDPFIPPQDAQGAGKAQAAYAPAPGQYQPKPQGYAQPPIYQQKPQAYAQPPVYQQPQQVYAPVPPKAPFTPQQALYGAPQQQALQKAPPAQIYNRQPQAVNPYLGAQGQQAQVDQAQALRAHKAAEAKVLAQHYQAQQAQIKQQQVSGYQPVQYGYAAQRGQYGQQY